MESAPYEVLFAGLIFRKNKAAKSCDGVESWRRRNEGRQARIKFRKCCRSAASDMRAGESWAKRPPSTHFSSQVDIIERSTFIASLEKGRSKLAKSRLRVIP